MQSANLGSRKPEGRSLRQSGVEVVWQLAQMVPVPLAPFTGGDPRRCRGLPRLDLRARPMAPAHASQLHLKIQGFWFFKGYGAIANNYGCNKNFKNKANLSI